MGKLEEFKEIDASYRIDNTLIQGNIIQLTDAHSEEYDNEGFKGQRWFTVTLYNTLYNTKRVFEKKHDGIYGRANARVDHIFIAGDKSFGMSFNDMIEYDSSCQAAIIN